MTISTVTIEVAPLSEVKAGAERNPYIHGLRGILAFEVFVFHVANSRLPTFHGPIADIFNFVFMSMAHGVEIFFGISGIVIYHAFLKSRGMVQFITNRMTRIYPVLWISILFIAAFARFDPRHAMEISIPTLIGNLFALPPLFPVLLVHPAAWSISFEFAFYGMFLAFGLLRRAMPTFLSLAVVGAIALVLLSQNIRGIGFVLGLAVIWWPETRLPKKLFTFAGLYLLCGMAVWHVAYDVLRFDQPEKNLGILMSRGDITAEFFLGAFLIWFGLKGVYLGQGWFSRMLLHPWIQKLGTISFSLYLWSAPVMAPVKKLMNIVHIPETLGPWSQIIFFALSLGPVLWVSSLSQTWLEDKFTRWLRQATRRQPRVPAPDGAGPTA